MHNCEILAPAGDLMSLQVAVNSGANAVYLGANKFNARAGATNFTITELAEGVKYAHMFNVKVYLTINTLIKDKEFDEILSLVEDCINIGVDAFIVQDMGLARCLKVKFENIQLHASTQLAIHNYYGAQILEQLGFTRVVLSRECSIEDIKDIKENTNLEIEYFVQGALCVGFSGNCYVSSLCAQCSGNRGKCKQYCRLPYTAKKQNDIIKEGYLLSPSDQNLASEIANLIQAGVYSFKIEGRLKKASYIASCVNTFKKAINGIDYSDDLKNISQIYSRGEFNYGQYLKLQNNNIINVKHNNHRGKCVGKVLNVEKFKDIYKITVSSSHSIATGDALKFYVNDNEICSLGVGNVEHQNNNYVLYSKNKPVKNANVHLIVNSKLESELININKKLNIEMQFYGYTGTFAKLIVKHNQYQVEVKSDFIIEAAEKLSITEQDIKENLSKLNNTLFQLADCKIHINNIFIRKSEINNLRRNAIIKLEETILEDVKNNVNIRKIFLKNCNITCKNSYLLINNESDITDNNKVYIYSPDTYNKENILKIVNECKLKNVRLFLDLPIIARHHDLILLDDILNNFNKEDFGVIANNLYAFKYKNKFEIIAGFGLNIINNHAKNFYLELGAIDIFYSIESNLEDVKDNGVIYSYGTPALLTLTHCPIKMLYNCNCSNCKYENGISYYTDNLNMQIRRKKVSHCYFELLHNKLINNKEYHKFRTFEDLRNININQPEWLGMINKQI